MASDILLQIEAVSRSKGIDVEKVIRAVEDAVTAAAKKHYHTHENLLSRFNRESGQLELYAVRTVVEEVTNPDVEMDLSEATNFIESPQPGDEIELPREVAGFGRIAAQSAKQVIYQKLRDAERENIFNEFAERQGEILNGIVKRFERGDIIVDLGRTEAILPRSEQSRAERYAQGDRIRAVIKEVLQNSKGPQVVLSRTDPAILKRLFEMEVPEIYDGTVEIRLAVREPGERAKIAVISRDRDIDPVGACVGMKGSRVQAVIRELHGEKIDIIPWSDEITTLVTAALAPARINRVTIADETQKILEINVDDDQLSLAIGRRGQNVRLASRLVGWKVDVKSENERKRDAEIQMFRLANASKILAQLPGVDEKITERLIAGNLLSVAQVAGTDIETLQFLTGLSEPAVDHIHKAALALLESGYRDPEPKFEDGESESTGEPDLPETAVDTPPATETALDD